VDFNDALARVDLVARHCEETLARALWNCVHRDQEI
jgi:hypothetical protein